VTHLDPGLVTCTIVACLAIVGICGWLIAAMRLDNFERTERSHRIREAAREWGAHGMTWRDK
jgi:hypothetical protein